MLDGPISATFINVDEVDRIIPEQVAAYEHDHGRISAQALTYVEDEGVGACHESHRAGHLLTGDGRREQDRLQVHVPDVPVKPFDPTEGLWSTRWRT